MRLRTGHAALVVLACAAASAVLPGPGAHAATVDRAAAATQCRLGHWGARADDPARAAAAMAGRVRLGHYGTVVLAADPSWKPQKTLDASGNANVHGLHWLLPLLREGVRTDDRAMVDRFYAVVRDWVDDNPPGTGDGWGRYRLLVEGQRQLTLACAAAGPRGGERWLATAIARHVAYLSPASRWEPRDNTALWQQMGLFASACTLRDGRAKALALARQADVTRRVVLADGSTTEGATSYSVSWYAWLDDAVTRVRACGATPDPALDRARRIPEFVAMAVRPDGLVEALGDAVAEPVHLPSVAGTVAEYAGSLGARGPVPPRTFARYDGGFVLGRTGWGTVRPFSQESWWSLRYGPGHPVPYHGHHDVGSVTLYSDGGPQLLDAGQYRYAGDARQAYVRSRAAHNVVTVTGLTDSAARGASVLTATSDVRGDLVDLVDPSYAASGVGLRRTVLFSRGGRWLLVVDRLTSRRSITAEQRWNVPTGSRVRLRPSMAAADAGPAGVSLRWLAGGSRLQTLTGSTTPWGGWVSPAYGSLVPSPQVRALAAGTSPVLATVVVPRAAGVPDSSVVVRGSVSATQVVVDVTARGTTQRWTLASDGRGTTAVLAGAGGAGTVDPCSGGRHPVTCRATWARRS